MTAKLNKAAFLGLDGTPHSLVVELMAKGVMPHLASLLPEGKLMRMETVMPEVSSVAWTTFMTGVNPGRHGVYGFMDLRPGTYDMFFPNYASVKAKPIWDRVGEAGGRSVVINVPSTYPARPLSGVMTAGFVALDLKKATYPDSAYQYLSGMGYRIDVDTVKARESRDVLKRDLMETLARRKEAILHFLDEEPWDLFVGVITETDRLHHFLWSAYADPSDPDHGFFIDYYKEIDSFIGEFAARLKARHGGAPLMIMSDHGFTLSVKEVYINYWLRERGYLKLAKFPPQSWADIAEGTRAFALDPSRIYINLKGKYPRGSVEPGAGYEALRDEIAEGLLSIEVDGKRVVKSVRKKEDLYSGPELDFAPDLVVLSNYGFDLKGALAKDTLAAKGFLTGMHTQDDAMLYVGGAKAGGVDVANILDAPATLANIIGLDATGFEGSAVT